MACTIVFEARFDPKTFCSLGLTKHTQEGPQKRDTQVTFDYPKRKSVLQEKNLKTARNKHWKTTSRPA